MVLLARGGGSKADLAAFDHERVARAVALCVRPVFTGIGHQVDRSVADEVAHTCCATPTAAAAAVVETVTSWLDRLERLGHDIRARSRQRLVVACQRPRQCRWIAERGIVGPVTCCVLSADSLPVLVCPLAFATLSHRPAPPQTRCSDSAITATRSAARERNRSP